MFNKIILVGGLTRDIELRYTQGGQGIASTAIATSRKFTKDGEKREEVLFVDITFFGRSAEVANQYLRKGSKILVEGRLKLDQWTDQNGQKRSKHGVIVESMQMLDSKQDNGNRGNGAYQENAYDSNNKPNPNYDPNPKQGQQKDRQPSYGNPNKPPEIDVDEESLPF